MKKIVSSLLFLISIILFQQILLADSITETTLISNLKTAQTTKQQKKANKKLFYYYVNTKDYEKLVSISKDLSNFKLSKKEKYNVYFNLAKAYLNTNKLGDALTSGLEAEYLYPKKPETKLLLGTIYKNNSLYELAITKYKRCLELDEDNIEAMTNLGYIYNFLENYKISLDYFQQAENFLKKEKKHLSNDDYICMAISAKEIGLIHQARKILENLKNKNKKTGLLLSQIYQSLQLLEKAQNELIPFVYKEDTDIEIYCNLATLYILSKKFNQARDLLTYFKSKNQNKNFEVIDLLLAETFYNIYKDKQKTLNMLQEILKYTKSKYIETVMKKVITFEKNIKK